MIRTSRKTWTLAAAALCVLAPARPRPAASPRLVVLVAVDQMIPEQLERLAPHLDGGLGRFVTAGRVWPAAELRHAATETGPGHATLGTGVLPSRHGIVGNAYYDRAAGSWRYCAQDDEALLLAPGGAIRDAAPGGPSGANLLVPGFAERLRDAFPGSRSVAIAGKDRAATLMAGRRPDRALWWDRRAGGFTSSSAYEAELPDWVLAWNAGWTARADGHLWEPCFEGDLEGTGTAPDDRPGEAALGVAGHVFPYRAPALGQDPEPIRLQALAGFVYASPLVDRFVVDLAIEALERLDLGADGAVDLLALSLSACDTVGHRSGPYSRETTDVILRADDELERLFTRLDERLGPGGWIAALSSDHGVLELPEALAERGVGARRIFSNEVRRSLAAVREALQERFGGEFFGAALPGTGLTLDAGAIEAAGADPAQVRALARDVLAAECGWIADAYTWDELAAPEPARDAFMVLERASFVPARAPDVVLRLQPWIVLDFRAGTSHGTPYPYDRRVPVAFLGPGVTAGKSFERASPMDVLPTVLALLGAAVPEGLDGRPLLRSE